MTGWGEAAFDAYLPAEMVLGHADIAVVVTDRLSNLLYVNAFAAGLFRISGDVARLAGCPVLSLGLFADDGVRKAEDLAEQVLRGRSWEGTFEIMRGDGSRVFVRALAVPLRHPGGDIDGIVILAREVSRRAGQGQQDRIALLERIGERLAGSLEIGTTLRHVAEILVPQFADHCFIDLFQGDKLIRRAMRHASGWVPAAGDLGPGRRADPATRTVTSASRRWPAWTRSSSRTWTASTTRRPARRAWRRRTRPG